MGGKRRRGRRKSCHELPTAIERIYNQEKFLFSEEGKSNVVEVRKKETLIRTRNVCKRYLGESKGNSTFPSKYKLTVLVVDANDHGERGPQGDYPCDGAGPGALALLDLHPAVDVVAWGKEKNGKRLDFDTKNVKIVFSSPTFAAYSMFILQSSLPQKINVENPVHL